MSVPRPPAFRRLFLALIPAATSPQHTSVSVAGSATAGADSVPVGSYTQTVLSKLPAGQRKAIDGNIASKEPAAPFA